MNLFEGTYEEWISGLSVEETVAIKSSVNFKNGSVKLGEDFKPIPGTTSVSFFGKEIPYTFMRDTIISDIKAVQEKAYEEARRLEAIAEAEADENRLVEKIAQRVAQLMKESP